MIFVLHFSNYQKNTICKGNNSSLGLIFYSTSWLIVHQCCKSGSHRAWKITMVQQHQEREDSQVQSKSGFQKNIFMAIRKSHPRHSTVAHSLYQNTPQLWIAEGYAMAIYGRAVSQVDGSVVLSLSEVLPASLLKKPSSLDYKCVVGEILWVSGEKVKFIRILCMLHTNYIQ